MSPRPTTLHSMPVLAVVPDLYFATRIAATAKAAGVELVLVTAQQAVVRAAEPGVSLVMVELHQKSAVDLVGELKRAQPALAIVGFGPHVEAALLRDARTAGADAVLPRSQFVAKLAGLLEHGLAGLERAEDFRL